LLNHVIDPSRPLVVWGAGPVGKLWGRKLEPRRFIEVDPRNVGQTIGGASVISSDQLARIEGFFVIVAVALLSHTRERARRGAPLVTRSETSSFEEVCDFICVA